MKLSLMMLLLACLAAESFCTILVKPRDCTGNFKKMKDDMKEKKLKGKVGKTFDRLCIAALEDTTVEEAMGLQSVAWAEPDYVVTTTDCVELNHPGNWNADRSDQREQLSYGSTDALGSKYVHHPSTDGAGVSVAVIDTGVDIAHPDFENRAVHMYSAPSATAGAGDVNGHGTHVAGIIGSSTHGIAKKVTILDYRCLDDAGSNYVSELVACVAKVVEDKKAHVISMSLSGSRSEAFNIAVQDAVNSGISVVVSAGNNGGTYACDLSPASASAAITVGSTDIADYLSSFSNHGACVNILAPGSGIISTHPNGQYRKRWGTSMATPAVSGAIARMIGDYGDSSPPLTPDAIWNKLEGVATDNMILTRETPNLLLYIPCSFTF